MEKGPAEIVEGLTDATEKLLESLDSDGTCGVCEQPFGFHSYDCPIHAVRLALDEVANEIDWT